MNEKEIFNQRYDFNTDSPTMFYYKGTNIPVGYKASRGCNSYNWRISFPYYVGGKRKQANITLPNAVYEHVYGVKIKRNQMVTHIDGNKDNFHPDNLRLVMFNITEKQRLKNLAFDAYRNVILPRVNPDYYLDPADWTDPEALEMLKAERLKRATGESVVLNRVGNKQIWL